MSDFDPVKAMTEKLAGMVHQHQVIRRARDRLRGELDKIESEYEAMTSTEAMLADMLKQEQAKLAQLQAEAEGADNARV